ncbi:MAG TPA: ComF family protein [Accumulibacter sp.]|nr:ComF family protein [Accumulibacter sp.]HMW18791.1 ComF family protein [Accumulibacter sp.]HMX22434.1 ComF family protein [Accumulibacter sp.]HMY06529.1 ComF family protein [Accumulibacter sp.]HNC18062.1 ComF family protein [Accumulibacter sp.]
MVRRTFAGLWAQDCLLCGGPAADRPLCTACEDDLPRLPSPRCARCGLPIPGDGLCGRCLVKAPNFDSTHAAYVYDFPVDRLVQSFKYGHRLMLGKYFGRQLVELASGLTFERIIPLPLHPLRLRQRGFNQALELARPISRASGVPLDTRSCQRSRATVAQAELPWRERARNVRGAFACTTDLTGQRVLLVDDVMTTGASVDELARTVKLHGASEVTVLVLARALPR